MVKSENGMITCRGINLTDSKGNVVVSLRGDDKNSGVWIQNETTGHLLFLSANERYTGVGIYENGKQARTPKVSFGLMADGAIKTLSQDVENAQS
jgi:hypothetical protein